MRHAASPEAGDDLVDTQTTHAWQSMHPPLASHTSGWLEVGGGHAAHWEECGNPLGIPALFVHGGPGAGCAADDRRWFDPARYRIVLLDQRGAGRSRPAGGLEANTTTHLLQDMEALRRHLHIERWLLLGGSWGATLALAYAQVHPERVIALVLRGVFTATARERRWLYGAEGAATLHPLAWERLIGGLGATQGSDLPDAFHDLLHCGDARTEAAAARAWWQWECELIDPEPGPAQTAGSGDAALLAMARIGVHYARHDWFLDEAQLLRQAGRLREVPGIIVQGARDLVTPPAAALALRRAWPGSVLHLVANAGHSSHHPAIARQLIEATDGYAAGQLSKLPTLDPKTTGDRR